MRDKDYSGRLTIAAGQNIKERDYWLQQFSGFTGKSAFPYDSTSTGKTMETLAFRFPPELCSRIMSISKSSDYRVHMIVVTGIVLLLYQYTNLDDITVGMPIYKQEVEGELINTVLAVRNRLHEDMTFKELLIRVSKTIYEAEEHQNYPIETLVYKLNPETEGKDFPLFDIAVLLDTIHERRYLENIEPNMIFTFSRTGEEIEGILEYNALLYRKTTIEWIIHHLQNLLHNALNDVDCPLPDVEIMSEEERKRVLIDFNGKRSGAYLDKSICQWIEEHAKKTPDRIAVVEKEKLQITNHKLQTNYKSQITNYKTQTQTGYISYKELGRKAGLLAVFLREKGVLADDIAAIMLERSIEMIIGILGILKAGGAYLPIDPDYPQERIDYMLEDSNAGFLLTGNELTDIFNDRFMKSPLERGGPTGPGCVSPTHLCYIIYTSGSTGKPKGAMVEHIGMMNHMAAKIDDLQLKEESIIAQNAAHTFDISVWQFFAALMVGGQTIIYPDELVLEPDRFMVQLVKDRVTILEVVPSYFSILLDDVGRTNLRLEYLLVTGEEIKPNLVEKWFEIYPDIPMVNAYGPTEASDDITHHIMVSAPGKGVERIPIGKPLRNFDIYVMDERNHVCPIGVKGEIWVSGIGVGRGYLNNPELTAEKFERTVNRHSSLVIRSLPGSLKTNDQCLMTNDRLYRTGDLARWLPDGTLEYFGREDFQVKIRGFRIELGEIENRLVSHEAVKQGVVIAKEDEKGNKYLCAYVVPYSTFLPGSLKDYLAEHLPDYMVPAYVVQLEQMPLTSSGKIDRGALPEPDAAGRYHHGMPYITEAMLKQVNVTEKQRYADENEGRGEQERECILEAFNAHEVSYAREKTLQRLFEEQVERTPDDAAVVGHGCMDAWMHGNISITYRELSKKTSRLAYVLRERGVLPDDIIAIKGENSIEMVIGVLGILKSGGAYLPIGSNYPQERVDFILDDSAAKIFLDVCELAEILNIGTIDIGTEKCSEPASLAHIFYTSGTTGHPKGIMAEHRHVNNAVIGLYERIYKQYPQKLNLALLSPFYFDGFIKQTFGALFYGHTLVIVPEDSRFNGDELLEFYDTHRIDISDGTPTHLRLLLESMKEAKRLPDLKHFITAGDVLPLRIAEDFFHLFKDRGKGIPRITNLYGPTECCVDSTSYEVTIENIGLYDTIPIGKPMPNEQVYIFDRYKGPMPFGEVGELYIGGDGVTRGYLNNPELTAEKFERTVNGHSSLVIRSLPGSLKTNDQCLMTNDRLYRTGDLARWLPDGNIEFIGRMDHQVQIGGVRIEPEEIEKILMTHEAVNRAVVTAREEMGEKYLCAFVVFEEGRTLPASMELKDFLYGRLPEYMIPSVYVRLENMPLTPNGKVNRKILQAVEIPAGGQPGDDCEPPADPVEERLVELWEEVLNIKSPGVTDNFFDLGGHSLKAVILLSKIHKTFNARVTLAELFQQPVIRGLAGFIRKAAGDIPGHFAQVVEAYIPLAPVEAREYYPVSPAQKRLYILQQMEAVGIAYNLPQTVPFTGQTDLWRLEQAFRRLIRRHESLRTSFSMIDNEPVQRIHDEVEFEIEYKDLATEEGAFIRPFDLSRAPLLRVKLIRIKEDNYLLMLDMHHVISDGFSHNIAVKDFTALYAGEQLPPLKLRYRDYSQWQNSKEQKEKIKKQETFWLKEFSREIPQVNLPLDYPRPAVQVFEGEIVGFTLEEADTRGLKSLASYEGVTLYMMMLTVLYVFLSKISGPEEVIVGTAVAGRWHADLQEIIGMFVNTLALCGDPKGEKTFNAFLKEVGKRTVEAFDNQEYPFEALVEKVAVKRDAGRNPLFDVIFNFQSPDFQPGTMPQIEKHESRISKFDLTFAAVDLGKHLFMAFEYCTGLFKKETIRRWVNYFKQVIISILENDRVKISEIEIITGEEKRQILYDFNDTQADYPGDKTIHELFEEQVERTPDHIAVVEKEKLQITNHKLQTNYKSQITKYKTQTQTGYISYKELSRRAGQLAGFLREKGVLADDIVAIMLERSIDMIIGILGILKAGGAYLPIDPEYPDERIQYMLTDSGAKILLTNLPEGRLIHHSSNQLITHHSSHLSYIIYTSGTTGRPKGVMVEHRSVVRLVKNTGYIEFKKGDRILQTGALEFDASTFEIWGALLNGLTLYEVEKAKILSSDTLKAAITTYNITILWMTAPWFNQVSTADIEVFNGLRNLLVGGDVLSPFHINRVRERFPGLNVIDGYGPTENTTFSTTYLIDKEYRSSIPIGKPIANSTAYIVDRYGYLQPVGVPGELVVGGDGVARGYLNNPELTAEKFKKAVISHSSLVISSSKSTNDQCPMTNDKFSKVPNDQCLMTNDRLYRTGDLARWLSDGSIEFLGRRDQQVKVRGYRIELGEIENRLIGHRDIKQGVVIVREDKNNNKYLCAYVVPHSPHVTHVTRSLKEFLSRTLPGYMIPDYFVLLERIPLTPNGKIDRRALPEPVFHFRETYAQPRDEIEEKLVGVWSEILGMTGPIGIHDNFFEIGGNSLKAVQVVSMLIREYDIAIDRIFQYPTIAELAPHLVNKKDNLLKKIQQAKENLVPRDADGEVEALTHIFRSLEKQHRAYIKQAEREKLPGLKEKKDYRYILVTGSTGYLGSHLVHEFLKSTRANLCLLVRAGSIEEAEERLTNKFSYYFGPDFFKKNRDRFFILAGDLRDEQWGIHRKQYDELSQTVDAVVHAAANVRHFGRYEVFYEDNVKATENLLKFALAGREKDFHHISTISVGACPIPGKKSHLFTEYSHDVGQQPKGVYVKSKLEAEKKVLAYRAKGLNASIYRVGNLAAHSGTGKFQENIEDNAFYANLKVFISLGMVISGDESWVDMMFIDRTAEALVLLMTRRGFFNETYHLQNIRKWSLKELTGFLEQKGIHIDRVTPGQFLDRLANMIETKDKDIRQIIDRYFLHSGMFGEGEEKWQTANMIVSDRTQRILNRLGFEWPEVTVDHIGKMIDHCREKGFID